MRRYEMMQEKQLAEVICNKCGLILRVERGVLKEGCFHGEMNFGYFSRRDGVKQNFDLCEDCYEEMIAQFALPPGEEELPELM